MPFVLRLSAYGFSVFTILPGIPVYCIMASRPTPHALPLYCIMAHSNGPVRAMGKSVQQNG